MNGYSLPLNKNSHKTPSNPLHSRYMIDFIVIFVDTQNFLKTLDMRYLFRYKYFN